MLYWVYNTVLTAVFVLALPVLPLLLLLGERFRRGLGQRAGFYGREVRDRLRCSRPIWIHAASVGEVLSAGPLTEKLKERYPGRCLIVSTFTSTGNRIARRATAADLVLFLPLDHPWIVRRSLSAFEPSALIFLETEIWPNLLRIAYEKGIPTLLLSGRLSARALKRYTFFRLFFKKVVRQFTAMGMQSEEDAGRMTALGVDPRKISITGSLKHAVEKNDGRGDGEPLPARADGGEERRRLVVAGSTHRGEEEILLDVFVSLKRSFPDLQLVLAPRHPKRFAEVERLLHARGMAFERKSLINGRPVLHADVLVLDTMGDLAGFYAVADIAFVGGSLVDKGGHNLLEPARFRKPVLFGPHMTNSRALAAELKANGGGIEVSNREDLLRELSDLLRNPEKARTIGVNAYRIAARDRGVVEQSLGLVGRYLES